MSERHVQARREHDVVLPFGGRRVCYKDIPERILPAKPFVDLGYGTEIKSCAILADVIQVRVEEELLR
jgi:hypothetical protein